MPPAETLCESLGCASERWEVKSKGSLSLGRSAAFVPWVLQSASLGWLVVFLPGTCAFAFSRCRCPHGAGLVLAAVGSGQGI